MAKNTFKNTPKPKNESRNRVQWANNVFDNAVNLEEMLEKGLPTRYIPRLIFLAILGIFYVGNAHYAEKVIRQLNKTEIETENLRSDYITSKVEFLYATKQSEIVERAKKIKLIENNGKTYKIYLENKEKEAK